MRLMAYTPCYRREAGSAGRDTRGLLRVHEFDKVEILAYATPEQAPALLDEMLGRAEGTIADLGLAYRVVEICTGDLGQSHHRTFDIEVYAPGCDQWLEVVVGVVVQRLPGPPGQRPLPARRAARAPSSCTRSTARPSPCPGCGPPSSRPTASPTARRRPRGPLALHAGPHGDPIAMTEERVAAILKVRDVEASLAWYGQLGFEVRGRFPEDGPTWAEVGRDGSVLHLLAGETPWIGEPRFTGCFYVPPGERRRGAGGHERQGRAGVGPGGARGARGELGYVDPDGYTFTFTELL